MTTMLFLLALAIIVLGPKKSIELSRMAGEWYRKAQAIKDDLAGQFETEMQSLDTPTDNGVAESNPSQKKLPAESFKVAS